MRSGGDLRNDARKPLMKGFLRRNDAAENFEVVSNDGGCGLIASRFNGQDIQKIALFCDLWSKNQLVRNLPGSPALNDTKRCKLRRLGYRSAFWAGFAG